MNELLFIRHPETYLAGTFCGQADPPVNAAGLRQLGALVENLRREPITAIFTSDLQRASAAAQVLAQFFNVPCISRRGLREIGFGQWEGLAWKQIETLDKAFAAQWLDQFPRLTPPHGESYDAYEARVKAEVDYLLRLPQRGLIAVVTHAGVMRLVLKNYCGVDESATWVLTREYCSTFRYLHHVRPDQRLQEVHA